MKKKNFLTTFVEYMKVSPKLLWGIILFSSSCYLLCWRRCWRPTALII